MEFESYELSTGSEKDLSKKIAEYLRDGWVLYGDPFLFNSNGIFGQGMVKPKEKV